MLPRPISSLSADNRSQRDAAAAALQRQMAEIQQQLAVLHAPAQAAASSSSAAPSLARSSTNASGQNGAAAAVAPAAQGGRTNRIFPKVDQLRPQALPPQDPLPDGSLPRRRGANNVSTDRQERHFCEQAEVDADELRSVRFTLKRLLQDILENESATVPRCKKWSAQSEIVKEQIRDIWDRRGPLSWYAYMFLFKI
jgi:hypothetical protein